MTDLPVAEKKKPRSLRELVVAYEPQFRNALPAHMDAKRFVRILLTEMTRNPKLADCTADSVMRSALQSAQTGLEPDSVRGQAYLIPYGQECTFVPGYRGLIELAYRSGRIQTFNAQTVYEGDTFELELGTSPRILHVPAPAPAGKDERRRLGAYSVVLFKDGGHSFEWMWEEDIQRTRNAYSKASRQDAPWKTNPDEMRKKTVVRRHAKYLPQCPELQFAGQVDESLDAGIEIDVLDPIDVTSMEAAAATTQKQGALRQKYGDQDPGPPAEGA